MIPAVTIVVLAVAVIVLSAAAVLRNRRPGRRDAAGPDLGRPGDRDESAPSRDRVGFTLYRPEEIRVGSTVQVVAYAHLTPVPKPAPGEPPSVPPEVEEDVANRFGVTDRVEAATAIQIARFAPSDVLTFRLTVEGCLVSPGEALVRWEPPFEAVPFRVTVPPGVAGLNIPGRLVVYQGIFVRGTVEFSFRVGVSEGTGRPVRGRAFDKVFPSYSHRDAAIVDYVEEAARTLGHEFLRDVRKLRVGEVWGDEIRGYIEEADLFQLFWSSRSMASPFVRQEWEHALSLGREGFLLPVYWEDPLPSDPLHGLPPPALNRIHFHRLGVAQGAGDPEAPTEETQRVRTVGSQASMPRRLPRAAWLMAAALLVLALGVPVVVDRGGGNLHPNSAESGGENPDPGAGGSRPQTAVISVGVPVGEGGTLTPDDRSRLAEAIRKSLGGADGEIRLVLLPLSRMDMGDTSAIRRAAVDLGVSYLVMGWEEDASSTTLRLLRTDTTGMIRR